MLLQILLSCIVTNFFPFYVHSISLTTLEYPCKLNEKLEGSMCECILECGVGMEHDSECEICVPCGGATYSDEVSTDTCQPCSGCYTGEETYRNCTTESDTKCICRGYLTEAHLCKPCTECSDTQQETEDCTLKHDRKCEVKPTPESKPEPEPNRETKDGLTISEIASIVSIPTSILVIISLLVPCVGWFCNNDDDDSTSSFRNYWWKYICFLLHCCNCFNRRNGQIQGRGQDFQDMVLLENGIPNGNNKNIAVGATPSGDDRPLVQPNDDDNESQSQGSNQDPEIRGAYYSRGISNGNAIGNGTAEGVRLIKNPRNPRDSIDDDDNDNDQSHYLDENLDVKKNTYFLHKLDYLFSGVKNFINKLAHNGGVSKITIDDIYKNYSTNAEEARYQLWLEWARTTPRKFQEIAQCELFPPELKSNLIKIAKECSQGKTRKGLNHLTNVGIKDMCETNV